jgi:hypothetical protein
LRKSHNQLKKYDAVFEVNGRQKVVSFGARKNTGESYSDFTKHGDESRKQRYLARHKAHENWNNPLSPGALSRWLLWNKKSLRESVSDFKRRFHV